ncbi:hypothetical protein B296_00008962 [Ensete ventricosum]|uniref:Uncharacterized protein n=1 Tax=Ensete ventricosum TaxID=4639 RepID=A0A427A3X1_ENSVE|nr:hypothetical protein B296_00008962 [Ensete ventricosum]
MVRCSEGGPEVRCFLFPACFVFLRGCRFHYGPFAEAVVGFDGADRIPALSFVSRRVLVQPLRRENEFAVAASTTCTVAGLSLIAWAGEQVRRGGFRRSDFRRSGFHRSGFRRSGFRRSGFRRSESWLNRLGRRTSPPWQLPLQWVMVLARPLGRLTLALYASTLCQLSIPAPSRPALHNSSPRQLSRKVLQFRR